MATLNIFPARLPIGVVQDDGSVLMTPEFFRAMTDLLQRVGGQNGTDNSDLELMANIAQSPMTDFNQIIDAVAIQQANEANSTELRKRVDDLEAIYGYTDPFRVNWERPGPIGSLTPNSGAFTTLTASSTVTLSPANANVTISPTGTGTATFAPATAGTINNMSIGATTRSTGAFTTLDANAAVTLSPANANVVISPTGTGIVTIAPATAGTINNMSIGATTPLTGKFTSLTATLGFGCNGQAAQTAVASGGAVVTTASTNVSPFGYTTAAQADRIVALLNTIRSALVANGIMS